jgi:hypothetical protein
MNRKPKLVISIEKLTETTMFNVPETDLRGIESKTEGTHGTGESNCAASGRKSDLPDLSPVYHCLDYSHPTFREPGPGELILGIYRENDGTLCPILLWADPNQDRFWDVGLREHVKPPRFYIEIKCQPQIDPVTGYPIIEGAVCPF